MNVALVIWGKLDTTMEVDLLFLGVDFQINMYFQGYAMATAFKSQRIQEFCC